MLTNEDLTELIEDMNSKEVSKKAATLRAFSKLPSGDQRVLPHLEYLLHDKTPCVLGYPYIFGEARWLAAHALAAERAVQGIRKPVRLKNGVRPIDTAGIIEAEHLAQINGRGGVEGLLQSLAILRDMGSLPIYDLILWPQPELAPQSQKRQRVLVPVPAL